MATSNTPTNTKPFYMKGHLLFGITNYAREHHTVGTRGSHLTAPFRLDSITRLLKLCAEHYDKATPGYRDGVIEVPVPAEGFVSAVRILEEGDLLTGSYRSRHGKETPRKIISTTGEKSPAKCVSIILYRSDVLAENGDNTLPNSPNNWEVVMVNASPIERPLAMHPMTMLANHFEDDGGTKTQLTAAELEEKLKASYFDWRDKALVDG